MVTLAPALIHFAEGILPHLIPVLEGKRPRVDGPWSGHLQVAMRRMEEEIEHRLALSVAEIIGRFQDGRYGPLMRNTPWDVIGMFMDA
jgi:hypothetical protein